MNINPKDDTHRPYKHFFCVCCGNPVRKLELDDTNMDVRIESDMYRDAMVDCVAAGFGSGHDGDMFFIAICDDCTKKAIEDGRLAYKSNYLGNMIPDDQIDDYYLKGYDRRTRDLNIDDILE